MTIAALQQFYIAELDQPAIFRELRLTTCDFKKYIKT